MIDDNDDDGGGGVVSVVVDDDVDIDNETKMCFRNKVVCSFENYNNNSNNKII